MIFVGKSIHARLQTFLCTCIRYTQQFKRKKSAAWKANWASVGVRKPGNTSAGALTAASRRFELFEPVTTQCHILTH